MFVTTDDFVGELRLSMNKFEEDKITSYINSYEKEYLVKLLGCELYDLFIADLVGGVPQSQRFIDIYNEFCEDVDCHIVRSEGIKKMLTYFIYFEFVKDKQTYNTITGTVQSKVEVSDVVSLSKSNIYQMYNKGVETYEAIQWFICDKSQDYTEENTQPIEKNIWL